MRADKKYAYASRGKAAVRLIDADATTTRYFHIISRFLLIYEILMLRCALGDLVNTIR